MTYLRDQLDLEAFAKSANDENQMPAAWLMVAILLGYVGVIGVVVWALVGALR